MKIQKKTIEKYVEFLKFVTQWLESTPKLSYEELKAISKRYGISTAVFYNALALGFFKSIKRGYYTPMLASVQPIHGRKLAQSLSQSVIASKKRLKSQYESGESDEAFGMKGVEMLEQVDAAISLLKSKGFKIMAPVTEYKEV